MSPSSPSFQVLYLAGSGRNGSTLLGYLLGMVPGFVNLGEAARYAFNRGMQARNLPCGCGRPVDQCPFWPPLLAQVPDALVDAMTRWGRATLLPLLRTPWMQGRVQRLAQGLAGFYRQVAAATAASWLVDTSKHPVPLYLLHRSGLPYTVLHLVRDPLAVVLRWRRPKGWLRGRPWLPLVLQVYLYNLWPEVLFRGQPQYLCLRWEDFLVRPRQVFARLLAHLNVPAGTLPFTDARRVRLEAQHALAGNPDKFRLGEVELRPRQTDLPPAPRWLRGVLRPLRRRYGYDAGGPPRACLYLLEGPDA